MVLDEGSPWLELGALSGFGWDDSTPSCVVVPLSRFATQLISLCRASNVAGIGLVKCGSSIPLHRSVLTKFAAGPLR